MLENRHSWRRILDQVKEHPAIVLWLIRDNKANTLEELLQYFGSPVPRATPGRYLMQLIENILSQLIEVGLIVEQERKYKATSLVWEIQSALGISLTELAQAPGNAMMVSPLFGKPDMYIPGTDIFVLMPFSEALRPVYTDHILRVANKLELSIARADDFYTTHEIMNDVWQGISTSKLIVADCTDRNPNVFYEIGIAHTLGKQVILITQTLEDIPFDLRHRRVIEYQYTPRGMGEFEEKLLATIKNVL
jgi:hypothetical protein